MFGVNLRKVLNRKQRLSIDSRRITQTMNALASMLPRSPNEEQAAPSPEAQARRIDKQRRYEQFARRQALVEIESDATTTRNLH